MVYMHRLQKTIMGNLRHSWRNRLNNRPLDHDLPVYCTHMILCHLVTLFKLLLNVKIKPKHLFIRWCVAIVLNVCFQVLFMRRLWRTIKHTKNKTHNSAIFNPNFNLLLCYLRFVRNPALKYTTQP